MKTIRDRIFSPSTSDGDIQHSDLSSDEVMEHLADQNKYAPIKFLGKGGMGVINLSEDMHCLRKVAVKSLSEKHKDNHEAILRFTGEAQIAAQLEHPNIVPIYDLGINGEGLPFYAMKHIYGKNLSQIIHKIQEEDLKYIKKFTLTEIVNILSKICDAMNAACSKGVLHRDLKPENVMIGEYGEVTVVDWGLAKVITSGHSSSEKRDLENVINEVTANNVDLSSNNILVGTPAFMAPERILGEESEQGEIYAIGAILYSLLSLEYMYTGSEIKSMLQKICAGEFRQLNTFNGLPHMPGGKIPSPLIAVVNKAVHKDRQKRYKKIIELRHDLEAYLQGFATGAEEAGVGKLLMLTLKRKKKLALFISFLCIILLFTVVWSIIRMKASEKEAEHESTMAAVLESQAKKKSEETMAISGELEKKIRELKESAPVLYDNALINLKAMDFDRALSNITQAITLEDKSADYFEFKAYTLLAVGRVQPAVNHFKRASTLNKKEYKEELSLCSKISYTAGTDKLQPELIKLYNLFMTLRMYSHAAKILDKKTGNADVLLRNAWIKKLEGSKLGDFIAKANWRDLKISNRKFQIELNDIPVRDLSPLRGMPLERIRIRNCSITTLEPLKGMKTLTAFTLENSDISDISPLAESNLTSLTLHRTKVNSLRSILHIPLRYLNISNSWIATLKNLNVKNLVDINLTNSNISDFSFLSNCQNELNIYASGCKIRDIKALKGVDVKYLDISDTLVAKLDGLGGNNKLTELNINNCFVKVIFQLRQAPLIKLRMSHCPVKSLAPLSNLKSLEEIDLSYTLITSVRPLKNSRIKRAELRETNIHDISEVLNDELEFLNISSSNFINLEGIEKAPNLTEIIAPNCNILDIPPISKLKKLKILDLSVNKFKDVSPLAGLNIEKLYLNHTKVKNISALKTLTKLKHIFLKETEIEDISALRELSLKEINLEHCRLLKDLTPIAGIKSLENLIVPRNLTKEQYKMFDREGIRTINWSSTRYSREQFFKLIEERL